MKKVWLVFVFLTFSVIILKGLYEMNAGFRIEKIYSYTLSSPNISMPYPPKIDAILQEPFYYLGKGRQSFVFESQDHKYVIKLIRNAKYLPSFSERLFPFFHKTSLLKKKKSFEKAMKSYQIVSSIPSITHTLYLQFFPSPQKREILLIDKLGKKRLLSLNKCSFILQEKGELLKDLLVHESSLDKCKTLLKSYITLIKKRNALHIYNADWAHAPNNTGVIQNEVFEIDVGSFVYQEMPPASQIHAETKGFQEFLEKQKKELLSIFLQLIKEETNVSS